MKKEVYLIAQYFPSLIGGAEKSIIEELKEYKSKGYSLFVICFDEFFKKGNFVVEGIKGINLGLRVTLPHLFRLYSIMINKTYFLSELRKFKKRLKQGLVITQSLIAPFVAEFCIKNKIKYIYYLRDELNLNEFHNYEIGFRRIIKYLKSFLELPAIFYYKVKNKTALEGAYKIISNSKFIQQLLKKKFNLFSEVKYPKIDYSKLKKSKIIKEHQKYITFIGGGNAMKGYDIVLKIAKKLPSESFLIVGPYKKGFRKGNILFEPYSKDVMKIYEKSKIVLVPSRWNEAFGRVVSECNYLQIPVVTSNKGGLFEANKNRELIVDSLVNIDEWVKKIRKVLK